MNERYTSRKHMEAQHIGGEYIEGQTIADKDFQNVTIEQSKFVDCDFENCRFEECKIIGCVFVNCRFFNCTVITLSSRHSEVKNAVLKKCNLIGVHWNTLLPSGKYAHAIDKLENCYVKYNSFVEMNFVKFDFSDNRIEESVFEQCNLAESNFCGCRMEGTQIVRSDIRKADFRDAVGYVIDVISNKMSNARFSFPEVIRLLDSLQIKID